MFENLIKIFKKLRKKEEQMTNATKSKDTAKERLHLVLMQDRANMSVDFLELMKQEIIDVIKKYIDVDENLIDVRLKNKLEEDGTNGAPFLYANIPVANIKSDVKKDGEEVNSEKQGNKDETSKEHKEKTKVGATSSRPQSELAQGKEESKVKKPEKVEDEKIEPVKEEEQEIAEEITEEIIEEKAIEVIEEAKEEAKEEAIKEKPLENNNKIKEEPANSKNEAEDNKSEFKVVKTQKHAKESKKKNKKR